MQDPALLDRAIGHLSSTLVREQATRENIAVLAVEYFHDDPPLDRVAESQCEDWLNVFSALSSRASSQTMQEHWAQILAEEVRKPGAFSLATLQIMSVMDRNLAEIVVHVWPYIVSGDFVPIAGRLGRGQPYSDLVTLDALGQLHLDHGINFTYNNEGRAFFYFRTKALLFKGGPGNQVQVRVGLLTKSGIKLMRVVPLSDDVAFIRELGQAVQFTMEAEAVFLLDYNPISHKAVLAGAELIAGDGQP